MSEYTSSAHVGGERPNEGRELTDACGKEGALTAQVLPPCGKAAARAAASIKPEEADRPTFPLAAFAFLSALTRFGLSCSLAA